MKYIKQLIQKFWNFKLTKPELITDSDVDSKQLTEGEVKTNIKPKSNLKRDVASPPPPALPIITEGMEKSNIKVVKSKKSKNNSNKIDPESYAKAIEFIMKSEDREIDNMVAKKIVKNNKLNIFSTKKHPKCKSYQCNHPLDPVEYSCGYNTKIECDECIYNNTPYGRKNPAAKCNQL